MVKKHQHKHNLKHRYEVLETLGRGTYGKVKKALERGTGRTVAIKSIRKDKITDDLDKVHIQREIEIMSSLEHSNIIQIYEVFENKDKIIIVMEYASNGELYDHVNNRHRITENEARNFFRQIVSAVHYCHKNGVVHRDLKLENVLLDDHHQVKLADFGLSNHYCKSQVLQTYCGSPLYASPEIVNGLPYQGPEVDCWALGVLLYALLYGSMPFNNSNYNTLTEQISRGEYRKAPHQSDACGLIDWMLTVNVKGRATIEDIANHWWVNWSYSTSVCDCESGQSCHSPLLARYIDWQNRPFTEPSSCALSLDDLEQKEGLSLERTEVDQYKTCLKKSKKENDMKHPQQEMVSVPTEKKPKGILKTRSSFDSAFLSTSFTENLSQLYTTMKQERNLGSMARSEFSYTVKTMQNEILPKVPKKGILKKPYERESGYSSSPERGDSLDIPTKNLASQTVAALSKDKMHRKKGILKRNGKFSASLDLPDDSSVLKLSESMKDLILTHGCQPAVNSRPPSVISDDSLLSSDSFDLLDLAVETKRQLFAQGTQKAIYCSPSEEGTIEFNEVDLCTERTTREKDFSICEKSVDKKFSLMEMGNPKDVYKKAQEICVHLN
uniref:non-specific serine/threonine protein kinase n=2 Tax=Latimeria chalumnae TaxID=7897 RepID=H3AHC1_LATCH